MSLYKEPVHTDFAKYVKNMSMKNLFKRTGLFKQSSSYNSIEIRINNSIY